MPADVNQHSPPRSEECFRSLWNLESFFNGEEVVTYNSQNILSLMCSLWCAAHKSLLLRCNGNTSVTCLCSLHCSVWHSAHSNSLELITVSCDIVNTLWILAIYFPLSPISGFLPDFSWFDCRFDTVMSLGFWCHAISTWRWRISAVICLQTVLWACYIGILFIFLLSTILHAFFYLFWGLPSLHYCILFFIWPSLHAGGTLNS